ncbi:MAG: prepilin peptidase [Planctomycetes bacterium]|nr:prepilin peptidase [Planctomycetota bacterium]
MPLWFYQHVPVGFFIFALGAIVGSFLNVVVHRLPLGMSVVSPPSRCPTCGARLAWHENLPIIGWFLVKGKCRYCKVKISPQYVCIEAIVALLFLGLYIAYYVVGPSIIHPWWGGVGGDWFYYSGVYRSSPYFIAHLFLVAGLLAMTLIDARTFTIPMQIPLVLTIVGFLAAIIQPMMPTIPATATGWPTVTTCTWPWFMSSACGMLGIFIGIFLLKTGKIRRSFADYEKYVKADEIIGNYPHARREMGVEFLFLLPCMIGLVAGYYLGKLLPATCPPIFFQSLGGALLGYLIGGGLIWSVRILGSLGFGKEAIGLGDVHLLAAVGAVLGGLDCYLVFPFIAPISGLVWVAMSIGLSAMFKRARRELPFGPHLAVATLVVILCRPAINWLIPRTMPFLPQPGLCLPTTPPVTPITPPGQVPPGP